MIFSLSDTLQIKLEDLKILRIIITSQFIMRIEGGSWVGQNVKCTLAILNSLPRRRLVALQTNTYA